MILFNSDHTAMYVICACQFVLVILRIFEFDYFVHVQKRMYWELIFVHTILYMYKKGCTEN